MRAGLGARPGPAAGEAVRALQAPRQLASGPPCQRRYPPLLVIISFSSHFPSRLETHFLNKTPHRLPILLQITYGAALKGRAVWSYGHSRRQGSREVARGAHL